MKTELTNHAHLSTSQNVATTFQPRLAKKLTLNRETIRTTSQGTISTFESKRTWGCGSR